MKLTIKNPDKLVHSTFGSNYMVEMFRELPGSYEWCLQEINGGNTFSVLLDKYGEWDFEENKWYYRLTYLQGNPHLISADWFGNWNNVIQTFEDIVEYKNTNKI